MESCNGKDDNCDGTTDENLSQSCYSGASNTLDVGACKAGQQACDEGAWGACVGEVLPAVEECDGVDNDCNGTADDGIADESCYTGEAGTLGVGPCVGGTKTCTAGGWGSSRRPASRDRVRVHLSYALPPPPLGRLTERPCQSVRRDPQPARAATARETSPAPTDRARPPHSPRALRS